MKTAVLTVSDGVSRGERDDESGALLERLLAEDGYEVVRRVVPDDRSEIAEAIEELTEEARIVLTTGGTGVAPRDVTPEATASVLERQVPGIAEAIRADAAGRTPHGLLSRGVAGVRGRRSSSISPARQAGAGTGSRFPARRSRTPLTCSQANRAVTGRREGSRPAGDAVIDAHSARSVCHACDVLRYDRSGEEVGGAEARCRRHADTMIHARGLGRRFGDKRVLSGLDLDVSLGEFLLVTGPERVGQDDAPPPCRGADRPNCR